MKIDPNLPYTGNVQNTQTDGVQDTRNRNMQPAGPAGSNTPQNTQLGGDTVQLSGALGQVQQLKAELAQVPEVRSDRVAALRQKVQEGSYNPSNEQVAGAMVSELFGDGGRSKS